MSDKLRFVAQPLDLLTALHVLRYGDQVELESLADRLAPATAVVFRSLRKARLDGQFFLLASEAGVLELFSIEQQQALQATFERQRDRNVGYLQLLQDYQAGLQQKGVRLMLLKGLYLGQHFAGGIERRFMWDADVLVEPGQFATAVEVAEELGLPVTGARASRWLLAIAGLHALEVKHGGQAIDIHWCFRTRPGYRIDYRGVWSRSQAMVIAGHSFTVPSQEDALLLLLLELASDIERSRIKLRTMWDGCQMLNALDAQVNWARFLARRKDEGLLTLAVNVLTFLLHAKPGADDNPALVAALAELSMAPLINSAEQVREILQRPAKDLYNRRLYARLQPAPASVYWIQRTLTAPIRAALLASS